MVGSWQQDKVYQFVKKNGPVCRKDIQHAFKFTPAGASRMFNIIKNLKESKTHYEEKIAVTKKHYLVEYIQIV